MAGQPSGLLILDANVLIDYCAAAVKRCLAPARLGGVASLPTVVSPGFQRLITLTGTLGHRTRRCHE